MFKAAALVCMAVLTLVGGAVAQDDQADAMAEWQKYMMPGEAHQKMEYYVGDWTYVNTSSWAGEPMVTEGTLNAKMMMDGRFLKSWTEGEMMGMPFEGYSISGYDNISSEHFNIWMDNMGTGIMYSKGDFDESGALVLAGTWLDPMEGEMSYRMVSRITGDDTYEFDMYMGPTGEEEKLVMEIKYTRVKSS